MTARLQPPLSKALNDALSTSSERCVAVGWQLSDNDSNSTPTFVLHSDELLRRSAQLRWAIDCIRVSHDRSGRVGIAIDAGIGLVVGVCSCVLSSYAYVPIDVSQPPLRVAELLNDAKVDVVLCTAQQQHRMEAVRTVVNDPKRVVHKEQDNQASDAGKITERLHLIVLDDVGCVSIGPEQADLGCGSEPEPCSMDSAACAKDDGTDGDESNTLCHVYFTSGTTGRPKAVLTSQKSLLAYTEAHAARHGYNANTQTLLASAHTFDPCVGEIFTTLLTGGVLHCFDRRDLVNNLFRCITLSQATHVCTTPCVFTAALHAQTAPYTFVRCKSLKVLMLGGEPVGANLLPRLHQEAADAGDSFDVDVYNMYGVTEATVYQFSCLMRPDNPSDDIGNPLGGVIYQVVDPETLKPVSTHEQGQLLLGGKLLSEGYLDDALTSCKFVTTVNNDISSGERDVANHLSQLFYRTGDLAYVDTSCRLRLVGRMDSQVKIKGMRVELEEIRSVLLSALPSTLADGYATAVDDVVCFHAVIRADDTSSVLKEDSLPPILHQVVVAAGTLSLPAHMAPRKVVLWDRIPLSPNGKRDGKRLHEAHRAARTVSLNLNSKLDDGPHAHNASPKLRKLCDSIGNVWQKELSLPFKPSVAESFLDVGGDSLSALRVCRALRSKLAPERSLKTPDAKLGTFADEFSPTHLMRHSRLVDFAQHLMRHLPEYSTNADCTPPQQHQGGQQQDVCQTGMAREQQALDALKQCTLQLAAHGLCGALSDTMALVGTASQGLAEGQLEASPGKQKPRAMTALHVAARACHVEAVTTLLQAGERPVQTTALGVMPAHLAAASSLPCLRRLLEAGTPVAARDANKQSLLHYACRAGNITTTCFLLGITDTQQHHDKQCPLPPLPTTRDELDRRFVREAPALIDVDSRDRWRRAALHWALLNGHATCAAALLASGAAARTLASAHSQAKSTTLTHEQPIHIAARVMPDRLDVLQLLVACGADISTVTGEGRTVIDILAHALDQRRDMEQESATAVEKCIDWVESLGQ